MDRNAIPKKGPQDMSRTVRESVEGKMKKDIPARSSKVSSELSKSASNQKPQVNHLLIHMFVICLNVLSSVLYT